MKRPGVVRKVTTTKRAKRDAEEALLPGERRLRCARPGCQNELRGQARVYCSPACHYRDRGRRGMRRAQPYHRCLSCGTVFAWNGNGKGVYCSLKCSRNGAVSREPEVVEVVELRGYRRADFRDQHRKCRACGAKGQHNHHVVYTQHVLRVDGDRWDPANALRLCLGCHVLAHQHEVPVSVLRPVNIEYAFELLGDAAYDYLKRYYRDDRPELLESMLTRRVFA